VDHCGFLQKTEEFSEYPLPIICGVLSRIQGIRPINLKKGQKIAPVNKRCRIIHQEKMDIALK
jgi:hypothetical protein